MKMLLRLSALEAKSGVNESPRIRVWPDAIEAKIDPVMARPDSADFKARIWGQVFDKNVHLIEDDRGPLVMEGLHDVTEPTTLKTVTKCIVPMV
jgi:hypothetical protein